MPHLREVIADVIANPELYTNAFPVSSPESTAFDAITPDDIELAAQWMQQRTPLREGSVFRELLGGDWGENSYNSPPRGLYSMRLTRARGSEVPNEVLEAGNAILDHYAERVDYGRGEALAHAVVGEPNPILQGHDQPTGRFYLEGDELRFEAADTPQPGIDYGTATGVVLDDIDYTSVRPGGHGPLTATGAMIEDANRPPNTIYFVDPVTGRRRARIDNVLPTDWAVRDHPSIGPSNADWAHTPCQNCGGMYYQGTTNNCADCGATR